MTDSRTISEIIASMNLKQIIEAINLAELNYDSLTQEAINLPELNYDSLIQEAKTMLDITLCKMYTRMNELTKQKAESKRNASKRARENHKAKEQIMRDCGLVKVRSASGTIYWE